jgi:hypothetical protein
MNDTHDAIAPAADEAANNSSVVPFPKVRRKRGRKPTRSPRCPVAHLHSPNDVRLLTVKLKAAHIVFDGHRQWAEIALENGISDPIEALQYFLSSIYRQAFQQMIDDACARYWFHTKPSHREEKKMQEEQPYV